jgi:hypothetical protein
MSNILDLDRGLKCWNFGSAPQRQLDFRVVAASVSKKLIAHQNEEAHVVESPSIVALLSHKVEITQTIDLFKERHELEMLDGIFEFWWPFLVRGFHHFLSKFILDKIISIS